MHVAYVIALQDVDVFVLAQQLTFKFTHNQRDRDAHKHTNILLLFLLTIFGIAHKLMNKLFCDVLLDSELNLDHNHNRTRCLCLLSRACVSVCVCALSGKSCCVLIKRIVCILTVSVCFAHCSNLAVFFSH